MQTPRSYLAVTALAASAVALNMAATAVFAADQAVNIEGFAFSPATVTVNVGDSVTWSNNDGTDHTATGSGFDTGNIAPGASDSVTFQNAGTFSYVCSIHPQMTGTVRVRAAGGGGAGATAPPTDTAATAGADDGDGLTATLAILGLAMVAGTIATDRLRRRRSEG